MQIPTPGPGGPRGPGRPMLPWGPGKPCNRNSHIRERMAQPGLWLPLWEGVLGCDWLILGGPGVCWQGRYEYSHGCQSQGPPDHPVKNTLHQPLHLNPPATAVTAISAYLDPGEGPAQMSLPPAQNFPKCGPPSSPQIWQGTIFPLPGWTWQCRCRCQCCCLTLAPAGPGVPGGPVLPCRGQGDIIGVVLAGGTGQGGGSRATQSQHCHPSPAPWGNAHPG